MNERARLAALLPGLELAATAALELWNQKRALFQLPNMRLSADPPPRSPATSENLSKPQKWPAPAPQEQNPPRARERGRKKTRQEQQEHRARLKAIQPAIVPPSIN